ncbi:MAG: CPBP family intramembrane metalloprotease [Clostridia bacterium]|nr:CPBP family intramembrane metalloprotease [Clostridia bacterium]
MDSLEHTELPQYEEAKAKSAYRRAGGALCAFITVTQISAIVLAAVAQLFFPHLIATDWFVLVLNFICIYCAGAPLFFLIISDTPAKPREKKKMSAGSLICAALIAVSCIYIFNILTVFISSLLENALGMTFPNRLDETLENANLWLAILSTVVVAPIMEELIFRKLLCDRLAPYGEWQAIVFTALAFSLFHTNLQQMLYAFALGCLFGVIYVRTGKIIYTIILHATVNFVGSVPGLLLLRSDIIEILDRFALMSGENDPEALMAFFAEHAGVIVSYLLYSLILVFVVVTGLVIGIISIGKLIRAADGKLMPKKRRIIIMYSGVFTVLYIVIATALTVFSLIA